MLRLLRRSLTLLLIVGLLGLNIATLAFGSVYTALSGALDALPGVEAPRARLQADIDAANRRAARLEADLAAAHRRAELMTRERDLYRTRARDLDADLGRTRVRTERLTSRIAATTARVTARMSVDVSRNVGSMAAEATPIVGAAAIVGVTAWEIVDACLTMRDMGELARLAGADGPGIGEEICDRALAGPDALAAHLWNLVFGTPASARESCERLARDGLDLGTDCTTLPPLPAMPATHALPRLDPGRLPALPAEPTSTPAAPAAPETPLPALPASPE